MYQAYTPRSGGSPGTSERANYGRILHRLGNNSNTYINSPSSDRVHLAKRTSRVDIAVVEENIA